jgi:hypothetical protein
LSCFNAFSALVRDPLAALSPPPTAETALGDRSSASRVCPEVALWFAFPRCPPRSDRRPRATAFPKPAPRGSPLTFMKFVNVKERSEERFLGWTRA